jgi:hypothetical protein
MSTCQRKWCRIVTEQGRYPCRRAVAYRAVLREARRNMVGISSAVEIRDMAGYAVGRQARVLPADVACRTLPPRVRARKRKLRLAVIKQSRHPCRRAVAYRAVLREARRNMVGISSAVEIRDMAGYAVGRQARVLPAGVACRTLPPRVRARKRKLRLAVIK